MSDDKKYFWLRLKKDFFKRHDIQILESKPNGKEYVLFYLKLLCESIDHKGMLRFSDDLPYSDEMLATITNTDTATACDALCELNKLGLIEMLDDGTFYLKQVESMTGCETEWAEKKRQYREKLKTEKGQTEDKPRTKKGHVRQEIEIEKEIDIDIKESREKKRKRFVPPTLDEVKAYCKERNNDVDAQKFFDYYEQGQWKDSKGNPVKNWKQKLITWENKQPKTEKPKSNTMHFSNERTNIDYEALKKRIIAN